MPLLPAVDYQFFQTLSQLYVSGPTIHPYAHELEASSSLYPS